MDNDGDDKDLEDELEKAILTTSPLAATSMDMEAIEAGSTSHVEVQDRVQVPVGRYESSTSPVVNSRGGEQEMAQHGEILLSSAEDGDTPLDSDSLDGSRRRLEEDEEDEEENEDEEEEDLLKRSITDALAAVEQGSGGGGGGSDTAGGPNGTMLTRRTSVGHNTDDDVMFTQTEILGLRLMFSLFDR
jgi:hypothetical protein